MELTDALTDALIDALRLYLCYNSIQLPPDKLHSTLPHTHLHFITLWTCIRSRHLKFTELIVVTRHLLVGVIGREADCLREYRLRKYSTYQLDVLRVCMIKS